MAKGASTEHSMGSLHNRLTAIFTKVLTQYETRLDAIAEAEDVILDELMETSMPSPAMLSAVAKFLKDNAISIESVELDELSSMERRLAAKKNNRPSLVSITNLPLTSNG